MGLSEDLERIALQEAELALPRLDAEMAWTIGRSCAQWLPSAASRS